ncbi:MAG: response regulator transcription factor [bacterium]|nr:response regulator transcription factor [bacterium]
MRVLIVEDDKQFGETLQRLLQKDGAAVDLVQDGEAAERHARAYQDAYDIILLDLTLPGKDGHAVCAALREHHVRTPILIVSGRHATQDIVHALDSGADDYITKPFSVPELQARIRALLRRPSDQQESVLRHGAITLDPNSHSVTCNDESVNITPKEYSLLEYFLRHPGQVHTRDQIINHVWDFAFESFSNVVDVHMKNLRKKLEQHGGNGLMKTVRGVGYRL